MIDNSGDPEVAEAQRKSALLGKQVEETALSDGITLLETGIQDLDKSIANNQKTIKDDSLPQGKTIADLQAEIAEQRKQVAAKQIEMKEKRGRLASVRSQIRKLRGESEWFLQDIVSDANGASFHRFQVVAWTIVLSIVFVIDVYKSLAMPIFDATLLGLMGVSSATYLGLKTTEPTTPTT